ncbi:hypothetical protein PCANC_26247, partial [Puccinia coronata f. sp. avenae]
MAGCRHPSPHVVLSSSSGTKQPAQVTSPRRADHSRPSVLYTTIDAKRRRSSLDDCQSVNISEYKNSLPFGS